MPKTVVAVVMKIGRTRLRVPADDGIEKRQSLSPLQVDVIDEQDGVLDHDPAEQDDADIGRSGRRAPWP